MINKITRNEYPDFWNSILDGFVKDIDDGHSKGASYYSSRLIEINTKYIPELPEELNGYWITDSLLCEREWGYYEPISTLYRATEKVICNKEWFKIDDVEEKKIPNYTFEKVEKMEYDIVYDGNIYGTWDNEKQIDCPEDLTLQRDLSYLIDVGIDIGKQMIKDELKI